jgi:hypothetical protein
VPHPDFQLLKALWWSEWWGLSLGLRTYDLGWLGWLKDAGLIRLIRRIICLKIRSERAIIRCELTSLILSLNREPECTSLLFWDWWMSGTIRVFKWIVESEVHSCFLYYRLLTIEIINYVFNTTIDALLAKSDVIRQFKGWILRGIDNHLLSWLLAFSFHLLLKEWGLYRALSLLVKLYRWRGTLPIAQIHNAAFIWTGIIGTALFHTDPESFDRSDNLRHWTSNFLALTNPP